MGMRVSLSGQHVRIDEAWRWYETLKTSLYREREHHVAALYRGMGSIDNRFLSFDEKELRQFFDDQLAELMLVASLNLLASVEASLRIDYLTRVTIVRRT